MGNKTSKQLDNSLNKNKSQSVMWNFRYSTLRKKGSPAKSDLHLDVKHWLEVLDLPEYKNNFKDYNGVENLLNMCEADIKLLGINNSAHRARIVSSLVALRKKYQKNLKDILPINGSNSAIRYSSQRHSVAVDPSNSQALRLSNNNNNSTKNGKAISSKDITTMGDSSDNKNHSEHPFILYETLDVSDGKQSKSCGDLLDMEASSLDVQQSIALKKALEWELSLDSRDLKSHAWYHGPIQRQHAEEFVQKEGDFLVRDCASQPGNFVLTCRTKISTLHFVINKILIQPETVYERVQYQFEDDAYDTVPDLITYYVGSGKSISAASGARIQFPCNRKYPLSFYDNKYNNQLPSSPQIFTQINSSVHISNGTRCTPYNQQQGNYNSYRSPMSSPPRTKRENPPKLPSKKQRSQPGINSNNNADNFCSTENITLNSNGGILNRISDTKRFLSPEKCSSADGVIQEIQKNENSRSLIIRSTEEKSASADGIISNNKTTEVMSQSAGDPINNLKFSTHSLQKPVRLLSSKNLNLNRDISDNNLNSCLESNNLIKIESNLSSPPPKPLRTPSNAKRDQTKESNVDQHPINRIVSYHASGSDSGNGSGDSVQSSAAGDPTDLIQHRGGVVIKNPRFMVNSASSMTLKSFNDFDAIAAEQMLATFDIPVIDPVSQFDIENFQTLLLPTVDNKPLDSGALNTFRLMLSETGPRILAQHLTRIDIGLILENPEINTNNKPLESTGLELITLPHGSMFRKDLIERTQCLKLLVVVSILTCQSDFERAEMINKWIQVAIDTKTAVGNLFGFSSIMLGLCMPQIQKLETAWHILRQKFTESAFNFEAKLRPTLKSMNECSNPQAPNTTVPHLLPYILVRERNLDELLTGAINQFRISSQCINTWETNSEDFGISTFFVHLDASRNYTKNLNLYKRNAQIVIEDSKTHLDELLLDAFRTEFHVKFLWGSKGAFADADERHSKLEQVLDLMAEKFTNEDQISCAA